MQPYPAALRALQLGEGDPLALAARAAAESPRSTAAHVLRATLLIYSRDRGDFEQGLEALSRLTKLDSSEPHAAALERGAEGEYREARVLYDRILAKDPHDFLALWASQVIDYYLGEPQALAARAAQALSAWSPTAPGYHAVLAMHAFGLEESGDYAAAEKSARRALALEPDDERALHALLHVFEMQGRPRAGLRAIAARARRTTVSNHLWWHAALFHLQERRPDEALRVYETRMRLGSLSDLIDASSLLWRLQLSGVEVGDWFAGVADRWVPHAGDGYCSFNDLHAMMAFVATRRWSAAEKVIATLVRRASRASGANYEMARLVGLPAARALLAFGQGQFARAETLLRALPPVAHRIGGSHAQRDVLQLTRAAAAAAAQRNRLPRALQRRDALLDRRVAGEEVAQA